MEIRENCNAYSSGSVLVISMLVKLGYPLLSPKALLDLLIDYWSFSQGKHYKASIGCFSEGAFPAYDEDFSNQDLFNPSYPIWTSNRRYANMESRNCALLTIAPNWHYWNGINAGIEPLFAPACGDDSIDQQKMEPENSTRVVDPTFWVKVIRVQPSLKEPLRGSRHRRAHFKMQAVHIQSHIDNAASKETINLPRRLQLLKAIRPLVRVFTTTVQRGTTFTTRAVSVGRRIL